VLGTEDLLDTCLELLFGVIAQNLHLPQSHLLFCFALLVIGSLAHTPRHRLKHIVEHEPSEAVETWDLQSRQEPPSRCHISLYHLSAGDESAFGLAKFLNELFELVALNETFGVGVEEGPHLNELVDVVLVDG